MTNRKSLNTLVLCGTLAWALGWSASALAGAAHSLHSPTAGTAAHPAPNARFGDEGAFLRYYLGVAFRRSSFKWQPDGTYSSRDACIAGTGSICAIGDTSTTSQAVGKDGRWTSITSHYSNGSNVSMIRKGNDMRYKSDTNPEGVTSLKPGALWVDYDNPALFSQMLRRYDGAKGGSQTFETFRFANPMPISLELRSKVHRNLAGHTMEFTQFAWTDGDYSGVGWADRDGKVYSTSVTSGGHDLPWVRQGYEALLDSSGL